jgi:hypothetical protein
MRLFDGAGVYAVLQFLRKVASIGGRFSGRRRPVCLSKTMPTGIIIGMMPCAVTFNA